MKRARMIVVHSVVDDTYRHTHTVRLSSFLLRCCFFGFVRSGSILFRRGAERLDCARARLCALITDNEAL